LTAGPARLTLNVPSMLSRVSPLPLVAAALLALAPKGARADEDPDIERIVSAGHSLRWNWTPPGKDQRYGHAEVLINAPQAVVRAIVADFGHYKDFVPQKFHNARIIGRQAGNTDVYMQVPVFNGMVTLWDVVRFAPARVVGPGTEVLEGRLVKGNVRDMDAVWTTRAVNENWTVLKFDLFLALSIPAPQGAVDEALRDAAGDAVNAIHDRAQGHSRWVPWQAAEATASQ
jgi:ribosome-associated toxin RatA of RatAB toxin-antitoxin module